MIELEMSKDIKAHEPKVIGMFTTRQLVCLGIAAAYAVPLGFLLPFSIMTNILVAIGFAAPVILCGWIKVGGLPLEKMVLKAIKSKMYAEKRNYITINTYEELLQDPDRDKENPRVTNRIKEGAML